ncbi:MAG: Asp-tRNA(Asn)/Glu-tRNA(Gln) amidotransferase A subunit family amidase, partial [Paracoccaceae bacterium]
MLILPALLLTFPFLLQDEAEGPSQAKAGLEPDAVATAARLVGLEFTDVEIELMLDDVRGRLREFEALRSRAIGNEVAPTGVFSPWIAGVTPPASQFGPAPVDLPMVERPENLEDVAFWSIAELAALLRQTSVTSTELTLMYLGRLERLDGDLHCVITLTSERALEQAARCDQEFADGKDRGLLHGIPWGVKDLMAVEGYRTTWGAKPFEEQTIEHTAEVVERLDAAGAVLIAKLSVGALAWGDVWFGGRTRSPWDFEKGSSGSSAGSASATAAGGVAFALGTETLGSIVSPAVACSTSALRPTFGRVSRDGVMALSWTMDKIGPITRTVADAALVFAALQGRDPEDDFSRDGAVPVAAPLPPASELKLRIGVPEGAFRRDDGLGEIRAELEAMGAELVPVKLPRYPVQAMLITLSAEAAAAFDELTRSGADDELVRQVKNAWPNTFRAARLIPAVEYLQAQRLRRQLMVDLEAALEEAGVVALVHPPYASGLLSMTNLTGHPAVVAPFVPKAGPREDGSPFTISFTGRL